MFTFIAIVAGSAVLISGVVAVAYTATKIKNDLDAANSAIADLEASTDIVTSNVRNKVKLTSDGEKIIGLKDGSLIKAQSTLTTVDFDTTEYGDRAVLQLRNDTGSSITLTGLSIRGKPVSIATRNRLSSIFFMLLIWLMLYGLFNDIMKPISFK